MTNRKVLAQDIVGELETVMKADSRDDLRDASLPVLEICVDHIAPEAESRAVGLDLVISAGVSGLGSTDEAQAIAELFLGENRWSPLAKRGAVAAGQLGISYDGLRRRNKDGHRRLDSLLANLADEILKIVPVDELLFGERTTREAPDPGANVFERASVFLSYSTEDDKHEGGIVSALRDRLISEFRFQTGQELWVFQDKRDIALGEHWPQKIDEALTTTEFLLVFLTPSYLRSTNCRDELRKFLEREKDLERNDLVFPIYYATVPTETSDPLLAALLDRQYVDWRPLRFQPFESAPVRVAVAELATSIAEAIARTSNRAPQPIRELDLTDSGELGLVERLAEMQLALPRMLRNLMWMAEAQQGVTERVRHATAEVERAGQRGRGSTAGLIIARQLAAELEPYAERMEGLSEALRGDLRSIDLGIKAMASEMPTTTEHGAEDSAEKLIKALRTAESASREATASVESMGVSYRSTADKVSTLRPVLKRLLASARVISECPDQFAEWVDDLKQALADRTERTSG